MHKIRVFCSGIFANDPLCPSGILKIPRATRRALGLLLRPEFGASRRTPASAPALGPGGMPSGFSKSPLGIGDLAEDSLQKTRIFYTYFFKG